MTVSLDVAKIKIPVGRQMRVVTHLEHDHDELEVFLFSDLPI